MSRSVLEAINKGIKDTSIQPIDDMYLEILCNYYNDYHIINTYKNRINNHSKYGAMYSFFDKHREKGTIEIDISNDDIISVYAIINEVRKNITYYPNFIVPETGIMKLEDIYKEYYCNKEKLVRKSLLLHKLGAIREDKYIDEYDNELVSKHLYSYDPVNKILSYDSNIVLDILPNEALQKVYKMYIKK